MNTPFIEKIIENTTSTPSTIIIKNFLIGKDKETNAYLLFNEQCSNKDRINKDILNPLMYSFNCAFPNNSDKYEFLLKTAIPIGNAVIETSFSKIIDSLNNGKSLLIIDKFEKAIIIDTTYYNYRSISNPTITSSIASSKEDLNESLETNISMIQRRVKDKNLKIESAIIGRRSATSVNILFIKDIANDDVVKNVLDRISNLDIDNIQSLGALQQYIEEFNYSIFPQSFITDSIESTVNKLLEGKVLVIMEGSPYALSLPAVFIEFFHSIDDYNERFILGSFARLLRFFAAIIILTLPSLYVILTKFNPELLIDKYIQPIAGARQGIPLSPFLEIFIMDIIIEFLREGGLRLPSKVAQTLSIVSGVILGDAAIRSRIISPPALFIVGISVVCTFLLPNYQMSLSIRLIKFPILILSNTFGIIGFLGGFFILFLYIFNLNVFGIDYISFKSKDMKDAFIRGNLKELKERPLAFKLKDKFRINTNSFKNRR